MAEGRETWGCWRGPYPCGGASLSVLKEKCVVSKQGKGSGVGSSLQLAGKRSVDLEVAAKSRWGDACRYILTIVA